MSSGGRGSASTHNYDQHTFLLHYLKDAKLELDFRKHHALEHQVRLRFMCVAGIVASIIQAILNVLDDNFTPVYIRAVITVILFVILAFTFSGERYLRVMSLHWPQHLVAPPLALLLVTGRIFAGGTGDLDDVKNLVVNEADLGFLFLVLGGLCSLSAIRFTAGLLSGVVSTLWFVIATFIWKQPSTLNAVETSITAVLAFFVFAYVAYMFERSERNNFMKSVVLSEENIDLQVKMQGFDWFQRAANNTSEADMASIARILADPTDVAKRKQLGRGGFGSVFEGAWRGTVCAIKELNDSVTEDVMREFHDEAIVMSQINHPNIVQLFGLTISPPMLIMELMPRGSVFKILHQDTTELHWTLKLQMALDAARGMNFLHTCRPPLIHRDLKSLNLLVARDWRVKVADFGLTTLQKQGPATGHGGGAGGPPDEGAEETHKEEIGTLAWTAPEVFRGKQATAKSDIYSFGIILYEILARKEPFKGKPAHAIPYLVGKKAMRPHDVDAIGHVEPQLEEAVVLMKDCCAASANQRPSFETIIQRLEQAMNKNMSIMSGSLEDNVILPVAGRNSIAGPSTPGQNPSDNDPLATLRDGFSVDMEKVEIGPKIGKGGNAFVYEGILGATHVAVKELFVQVGQTELVKEFQKECGLMRKLHHPNIVLFMGAGAKDNRLFMITELMVHGSLFRIYHHHRSSKISMRRRLSMAMDTTLGMQYLHSLSPPLIHRDLKSPNVLVGQHWEAKVADFGLSRFKDDSKTMTTCGSPLWAAPEVLRGERFGEPCDVFSFAIILWELLAWREPYEGMDSMQVMRGVANKGLRPSIPSDLDPRLSKLLQSMWHEGQKDRPDFEACHDALQEIRDSLA